MCVALKNSHFLFCLQVGCSKGYFMLPNLTCEACPVGSYHGAGQRHVLHGLPTGIIHPHHCESQRIQLQRYRVSWMISMQSGGIERAEINTFPDIQLRIVAINGLKESCGFMSDTSVKIVE